MSDLRYKSTRGVLFARTHPIRIVVFPLTLDVFTALDQYPYLPLSLAVPLCGNSGVTEPRQIVYCISTPAITTS